MPNWTDLIYSLGLGVAAPYWLLAPKARRKVMAALRERMGDVAHPPAQPKPTILIHAVSVGELNATRGLVDSLRASHPQWHILVTTTTTAGWDRAAAIFGQLSGVSIARFPLDFSWAVNRLLTRFNVRAAILMELEVWPNFMRLCHRQSIPVAVLNGRITTESFRRYHLALPVVRSMMGKLTLTCAQDEVYADRFRRLGATSVRITGTMKFDTAEVTEKVAGTDDLAADLQLNRAAPLWVCGSTGPGEEALILAVYQDLLPAFPALQLALIPRKPERFDEVAALITAQNFGLVRRSGKPGTYAEADRPTVILGDTMGELRKFYSLATVVFVGRTLVDLGPRQHGSDMIEPAALARPTVVGPHTSNFAEVMRAFLATSAMLEVQSPDQLRDAIARLLSDAASAAELGRRAQQVVITGRGATGRNLQAVAEMLNQK